MIGVGAIEATPFDPLIAAIPGFGPIIVTALGAIKAAETLIPQPGAGALKKPIVAAIVTAAHPGAVDPAVLNKAIDDIVAALNALRVAFTTLGA